MVKDIGRLHYKQSAPYGAHAHAILISATAGGAVGQGATFTDLLPPIIAP